MGVHHNKLAGAVTRKKVAEYKVEKGCMDCGNKNPVVLQFHHPENNPKTNPRRHNLHIRPYRLTWRWEKVQEELDKLDVLCANCHLIRHAKETE